MRTNKHEKDVEMLTIKQRNTTITIEATRLLTSRLIANKLCRVTIEFDGTVGDMGTKVNRVAALDDELYKQFSELSKSVQEDDRA